MKMHLLSFTPEPEKSIAVPFLNMGIGRTIYNPEDVSNDEAADSLQEIFSSHLMAPLEYAHFNFLWEDIPLFLRAHLVRARIGWTYAERSLRFYDATKGNPAQDYDWAAMPTIPGKLAKREPFPNANLQKVCEKKMQDDLDFYEMLLREGVSAEDARNFIGVWYPTNIQTSCSYLALRHLLANRLSSQAHPLWKRTAEEIKALITSVAPILGANLVDACQIAGHCVWNSRFDRDCDACIERGLKVAHEHVWNRHTDVFGPNTQCDCGIMKPLLLAGGENA